MTWTAFWYGIAGFFQFCFKIIRKLFEVPNVMVWVLLICLLAFWTLQLRKHRKQADKDGTHI
ncbi:MAG: hypothetical protein JST67_10590 [Bacteroidetes bacterium]|nr:hypothetical protein [Bacteroidota bacterium]